MSSPEPYFRPFIRDIRQGEARELLTATLAGLGSAGPPHDLVVVRDEVRREDGGRAPSRFRRRPLHATRRAPPSETPASAENAEEPESPLEAHGRPEEAALDPGRELPPKTASATRPRRGRTTRRSSRGHPRAKRSRGGPRPMRWTRSSRPRCESRPRAQGRSRASTRCRPTCVRCSAIRFSRPSRRTRSPSVS